MDETKLADEIVQVLPEGAIRVCSADREAIRYAVRSRELKLRTIILGRHALRRLLHDPDGAVKVKSLNRALLRRPGPRNHSTYPRPTVAPKPAAAVYPRLTASA